MTIKSKSLAAVIVIVLFGGILISSQLGWWKTESSKIAATFTEGEFAGQANPADIRGSYTFGDVEKNFGVPASLLGQAFSVKGEASAFQVKNLEGTLTESGVEIGTASVRLFTAFYKNLPFDLSTDIYIPEAGAALLKQQKLTAEQSAYLDTHTVKLTAGGAEAAPIIETAPATEALPVPETTAVINTERIIKGKTTFGEILGWGLSQTSIELVLGKPLPVDQTTTLKDFCSANSLDFETIKPALQADVDKLK
ncbi:MAG: hypothetical protein WCP19_12285 [Chloroflexota bacterium]